MQKIIGGIQQIGIGVTNVHEAWAWYRRYFGMNIPIFEEAAVAKLMLPYTGGLPQSRHAILAINLQGGGGFEIWQYTSRSPIPASFNLQIGDLGIYAVKIKSKNVPETYARFREQEFANISDLVQDPAGQHYFWVQDPYGNLFQVVPSDAWFQAGKQHTGGVGGCIIGVTDLAKSRQFYQGILGYDETVYDENGCFPDLGSLPGGTQLLRRVLLRHRLPRQGSFSRLLGPSEIELVQVTERTPKKIYEDRYWGDLGFIHLCYDVANIKALEQECRTQGFPFTINSSQTFEMGEAAGHFAYIEDPDGTLIEFVETHKIPIIKKLGWYLHLKARNPLKPLPDWLLKALKFSRFKG